MKYRLLHILGWALAVATLFAPVKPARAQTTQPTTAPATQPAFVPGQVGQVLGGLRDSNSHVFRDAAKESRAFTKVGVNQPPALRPDGWPAEDFDWVIFTEGNDWHRGEYTLVYSGQATVKPLWPGSKASSPVTDPLTGVTTLKIKVDPAGTPQLALRVTGTAGGLSNVRVWRPGYSSDADSIFVDEYLTLQRRMNAGVIRFMEWEKVNNPAGATWKTWADRTKVNAPTYTTTGVPPEICVELANAVGAEPWVNVPVYWDDDSVYLFARMVRDRTPAGRRVWVELHNELWNEKFAFAVATAYCVQRGNALLAMGDPRFHPTSPTYRGWQWSAKRTAEVGGVFNSVLGRDAVTVLAGCAANPEILQVKRNFLTPEQRRLIGVYAIAPYYGSDDSVKGKSDCTVETFFAPGSFLGNDLRVFEFPKCQAFLKLCRDDGKIPACYESGFYPETKTKGLVPQLKLDPRLYEFHRRYLDGWFSAAGSYAVMLNFVDMGPWTDQAIGGAVDRVTRLDAPQVRAIGEVSASHPLPAAPPDPSVRILDSLDQVRATLQGAADDVAAATKALRESR